MIPTAQEQDHAPVRAPSRKSLFVTMVVDFGLPLIVFYGLRAAGADQWWSLLLSGVNVVVTLLAAYLLPLDPAPAVLNVSRPVILVPTPLFHLYYTKKRDLRA